MTEQAEPITRCGWKITRGVRPFSGDEVVRVERDLYTLILEAGVYADIDDDVAFAAMMDAWTAGFTTKPSDAS